jgi:hypothetical protein
MGSLEQFVPSIFSMRIIGPPKKRGSAGTNIEPFDPPPRPPAI